MNAAVHSGKEECTLISGKVAKLPENQGNWSGNSMLYSMEDVAMRGQPVRVFELRFGKNFGWHTKKKKKF